MLFALIVTVANDLGKQPTHGSQVVANDLSHPPYSFIGDMAIILTMSMILSSLVFVASLTEDLFHTSTVVLAAMIIAAMIHDGCWRQLTGSGLYDV